MHRLSSAVLIVTHTLLDRCNTSRPPLHMTSCTTCKSFFMQTSPLLPSTTMGNQESTIADSLLSEQLKTLASKQEPEESYVYIQEKRQGTYLPCNSTISINKTEQWEKGLMQDPKVQCLSQPIDQDWKLNALTESIGSLRSLQHGS